MDFNESLHQYSICDVLLLLLLFFFNLNYFGFPLAKHELHRRYPTRIPNLSSPKPLHYWWFQWNFIIHCYCAINILIFLLWINLKVFITWSKDFRFAIDCHKGMFDYDVTCLSSGHVMWCIIYMRSRTCLPWRHTWSQPLVFMRLCPMCSLKL